MGSENSADQAWALVSSWLWDGGGGLAGGTWEGNNWWNRHPEARMPNAKHRKFYRPCPPELDKHRFCARRAMVQGLQSPCRAGAGVRCLPWGVVLRAVLFVESWWAWAPCMAPSTLLEWLARVALLTGGALPATLVWLGRLQPQDRAAAPEHRPANMRRAWCWGRWRVPMPAPCSSWWAWQSSPPGWPARPAAPCCQRMLVAALVLRARGRTPAATTARLTELQSRIRPHFLFNTLNSAIALVREEPAKAESLLEDLSDLFRHALVEQGEAVTLAEEITLAQRYLAIEEVRFGNRLQVQWKPGPAHRCRPPAPAAAAAAGGKRRQARRGAQRPRRQAARADRAARQPRGGAHHQHPASKEGNHGHDERPRATALRWPTCVPGWRCCTMCRASSARGARRPVPGAHHPAGGSPHAPRCQPAAAKRAPQTRPRPTAAPPPKAHEHPDR
jgi:hypothetical protein